MGVNRILQINAKSEKGVRVYLPWLFFSYYLHSDHKVLIVIGGDTYYKDDDEKDRFVISRWAKRKVSSQFQDDCLDGRTSFIFSWDKKHRPIHKEAMRHYFDPAKKGFKFEYTPKPKPLPRVPETHTTPLPRVARQEVQLSSHCVLCVDTKYNFAHSKPNRSITCMRNWRSIQDPFLC